MSVKGVSTVTQSKLNTALTQTNIHKCTCTSGAAPGVTTLLNTLMHNYNNYLYHVVFVQVMTLYIIKLCNCSPDCMYIIMCLAIWALALWFK